MSNCTGNDLTALAACFKQQAQSNGGVIAIDPSFLTDAITQVLGDTDLTIAGVDSTQIPDNPGNTLTISGTTAIADAQSILHILGAPICVIFSSSTPAGQQQAQIVFQMQVNLGTSWMFSTSFPELAGQAGDALCATAAIDQYLYISSYPAAQALPANLCPDSAVPADLMIMPGVSFWGNYNLEGPFTQVSALLTSTASPTFQLYGTFSQPQPSAPDFDLQLQNTQGLSFALPGNILTISQPTVGLEVASIANADASSQPSPMTLPYFSAQLSLGSVPLEIRANLWGQASSIDLAILPTTPQTASFDDLASLLGADGLGQIQTLLAQQPEVQSLLQSIEFQQFSCLVTTSPLTLAQASVLIGTSGYDPQSSTPPTQAWKPFAGVDLALAFNCYGVVFSPTSNPIGMAELQATAWYSNQSDTYYSFTVSVAIPEWLITGYFNGALDLNLSTLASDLFGNSLMLPSDLASFAISNLTFSADINHKTFSFNAIISGELFGSNVFQIIDTSVGLMVDASGSTSVLTGTIDGFVSLGGIEVAVDATISNDPTVDTTLSVHLVNETVGSILNHLVHLVDPTYDISLGDPWDKLLDINLAALVLMVTLPGAQSQSKQSISLTYDTTIDLDFISLTNITLTYTKGTTAASSVMIALSGTFLGQPFGTGEGNPPLSWDAINDSPPTVPGKGNSLFDLQYVGLGQHIAIQGGSPQTVSDAITLLRQAVTPAQAGQLPPLGQNGLAFSATSDWLIGAQFSVLDTVAISAVFNDPNLYGILVQLSGAKAKSFAGLSFEILYRKITDSIGVYHLELTLPEAMRNLQFGEVSITLPTVVLDIYTNGNFRVDFGFPNGLDFSNSFALQIFPFVGYGGFYFALLDGTTSSRVPQISNGTFAPVVEFGLALSVGVGKTISEGILSGGMTVTVTGILQGVLAWFNPSSPAPQDIYYYLQGTVSVVGTIYATVSFAIIQANVNVTAYASVTLTIEAYQPIAIAISAGVSVNVNVKVAFFTIHLSFSATINASFMIGSATQTPWQIARSSGAASSGALRRLRGQQTLHALASQRSGYHRMLRRMLLRNSAQPLTNWPAVLVLPGGKQTITLQVLPSFTKAEAWTISTAVRVGGTTTITTTIPHDLKPGDMVTIVGVANVSFNGLFPVASVPGTTTFTYTQANQPATSSTGGSVTAGQSQNSANAILLLAVQNSIIPTAATPRQRRELAGADPGSTGFNLLLQAMLGWGISVATNGDTSVAAAQLELLYQQLQQPETVAAAFDYPTLTSFLAENFVFELNATTQWTIATSNGATRANETTTITTTTAHGLSEGDTVVIAGVADNSFDGQFTVATTPSPTTFTYTQTGCSDTTSGSGTADLSAGIALFPMIPELTLTDSAGISVAFDSYTNIAPTYQATVQAYFQLLQVQYQTRTNGGAPSPDLEDESDSISMATVVFAQYFNMLMTSGVKAAIDLLASYPYTTTNAMSIAEIGTAIDDQNLVNDPMRIVVPNQDQPVLNVGALLDLPDVVHQIQVGETFASIADTFQQAGALNQSSEPYSVDDLLAANVNSTNIFNVGLPVSFSGISYTTQPNDTLNVIAARLMLRAAGPTLLNTLTGLAAAVQTLQQLNPTITDPNATIPVPTTVTLASGTTYAVVAGDTLALIAANALAISQSIFDLTTFISTLLTMQPNAGIQGTQPDQTLEIGSVITLPPITRVLAPGDTIAALAITLITTTDVIQSGLTALPPTPALLAPQGVLRVPLQYAVAANDTLSSIAAMFDLTLEQLAFQAAATSALFAANQSLIIQDLSSISVTTLMNDLLNQGEWNNVSGMVSRFLLSGLRLPDPNDPNVQALTPQALQNPTTLAEIGTQPIFRLTGQQFAITTPLPSDYQITLANTTGVPWLTFGDSALLTFGLTAQQQELLTNFGSTAFAPTIQTLARLALFQMLPPRVALQNHITWQAATPPLTSATAQSVTGNPSIWLFPDALLQPADRVSARLYEVVVSKQYAPDAPVTVQEVNSYTWATIVDITITLPTTDGSASSTANVYVVEGADDVGSALLQQVYTQLVNGTQASLFLLYAPNPTGGNPSGLASDQLNQDTTYLIKTNLSTLTHSGGDTFLSYATTDPTDIYAALLSDASDFIALLWEASITRSGGFYLNYTSQNGGAALPPRVFGTSSSATLALLIILDAPPTTPHPPMLPFHNCVVIGDNIDTSMATLFVQPATYTVQPNDTLTSVQGDINSTWGTQFSVEQIVTFNQNVPLLLQVGAALTTPNQHSYTVAYGDTFASIAVQLGLASLDELVESNLTVPILAPGSQMQFFAQPATYTVQPNDTLATVQTNSNQEGNTQFSVEQIATFNQHVPLLLQTGAALTIPNQNSYTVVYGDTLASIVVKFGLTSLDVLVENNLTAPILTPGSQVLLFSDVLQPATTVPPGTVGFELTRTNPDPTNLPFTQLQPAQIVDATFNLLGFAIAQAGAFTASGVGLPAMPADSWQPQSNGLAARDLGDATSSLWSYRQTLAVGPFGTRQYGSTSAALPAPQQNPYNGVGDDTTPQQINQVTINLNAQDIYGNIQPLPPSFDTLQVPVGYYDSIISLGSWPSLAISYMISGDTPTITFTMTMQQARYIPSPSVPVAAALAVIAADLASYTRIYYQLAQPDLTFSLQTTLDAQSSSMPQPVYPLAKTPFFAFAYGAYIYLAALATMQALQVTVSNDSTSVLDLSNLYGVTVPQLFDANQSQLYSALFGSTLLNVPTVYTTIQSDSLASIVANPRWTAYQLSVTGLAELNQHVALNPGADLVTPSRTLSTQTLNAAIASSGAVRSASTTTITTTGAHGFLTGDPVTVSNVADSSFNGQFVVVAIPNTTTFSYAQPSQPDATSGGGQASVSLQSLNAAARHVQASVAALAEANATATGILTPNTVVTVGTSSYSLGQNDSFANAATQLGATVAAVALANQWLPSLFVDGVTLTVTDVLVAANDTLSGLAQQYAGGSVDTLAQANGTLQNLFAPGTPLQIGANPNPTEPASSDTLSTFALNNTITLEQLANANATNTAVFATGASITIPGTLVNTSAQQYCTYCAAATDTLAGIAQKFGVQPVDIAALNSDIPGLLAAGQSITDTVSGQSVQTQTQDTFAAIIARFQSINVTVQLAQLVNDVAAQDGLVVANGLWICPPMLGGANGQNVDNSLANLASTYNTDTLTLATANAAVLGLLAAGVQLTIQGVTITTGANETLNSLVNRAVQAGASGTLAAVVSAVATTQNLIAPQASVVPVPPPAPANNGTTITPYFTDAVFQIAVNIVTTRNPAWIDPDFTRVATVGMATYSVKPEPDPQRQSGGAPLALTQFATSFQNTFAGLSVATGDPLAEGDPASASTIWAINFGSSYGPQITYQFCGAATQYFAIPPLATALMGGTVAITPYVSGQGLVGTAQSQTFQAIDLDIWLNTFLEAIDLFLSPAYVMPAYALDSNVVTIVQQKQTLAHQIATQLQYVLQVPPQGSLSDAQTTLAQALLTQLSSAFTINTLIQVPVTINSPYSDPATAPRLSGKIVVNSSDSSSGSAPPSTFSFSTAKVALTQPSATATFLFSVKTPAQNREVDLNLHYVITDIELPSPGATIGAYTGSSWLKLILPLSDQHSLIGDVSIPIPLRSYPSPVTLVSQTAAQTVATPGSAADLLGWNFNFVYQHDDAEQDTPLIAVTFNPTAASPLMQLNASGNSLSATFAALAQFITVYPMLKDDLALLPLGAAGALSTTASTAVTTFAQLVTAVVTTWPTMLGADLSTLATETYSYQIQKEQQNGQLTQLTISAIDPTTGQSTSNPTQLWPTVFAIYQEEELPLTLVGTPNATQAVYAYPPNTIPADTPLPQCFVFAWPGSPSAPVVPSGMATTLPAPQTFTFSTVNILAQQSGQAGVLITRNLSLVNGIATNQAFVYQTPLTNFASTAVPSLVASSLIGIGTGQTSGIASALGTFLEQLLTSQNQWQSDDTLPIRLSVAYAYTLVSNPNGQSISADLAVVVPITLVPSFNFDPTSDWDATLSTSFVSQIQAVIEYWEQNNTFPTSSGSYQFDLTIYANQGQFQPLIHATSIQYVLSGGQ